MLPSKNDTITALTMAELADKFGKSKKTLRTWLAPFREMIGPRIGRYFTPLQVRVIYKCIGGPDIYFTE